ncbi:hypothetical protein [Mesorhizobium sp. KR1-2]|uniref:hypothetical protein n=1 Tax=Mesorhizobium sp. KR1-2 TaxID=3156609 RepID=UPI0032B61B28
MAIVAKLTDVEALASVSANVKCAPKACRRIPTQMRACRRSPREWRQSGRPCELRIGGGCLQLRDQAVVHEKFAGPMVQAGYLIRYLRAAGQSAFVAGTERWYFPHTLPQEYGFSSWARTRWDR